jgi:hypothetical protein
VAPFNPGVGSFGRYGNAWIQAGQSTSIIQASVSCAVPLPASGNCPAASRVLGFAGDANPDFNMGFTNQVTYGPVRLSGLVEWRSGGDVVNLTNNTDFAGDKHYVVVARDGRVWQIAAKPHEVGYDVDAGNIFLLPVLGSTDMAVERDPQIDWNRIRRPNGKTFAAGFESVACGETGLKNVVGAERIAKAWRETAVA